MVEVELEESLSVCECVCVCVRCSGCWLYTPPLCCVLSLQRLTTPSLPDWYLEPHDLSLVTVFVWFYELLELLSISGSLLTYPEHLSVQFSRSVMSDSL